MIRRWINKFLKFGPVVGFLRWTKKIHPPGFEGLSLYYVSRFFLEGLQKGGVNTRAAAITFRMFLAIFPLLLALFALLPYIPVEGLEIRVFEFIKGVLQGEAFDFFKRTWDELFYQQHNDVLSIGFALSLFFASNFVYSLLVGFNGSYNVEKRGNIFVVRLWSLGLMLFMGILLVVGFALTGFSGTIIEFLQEKEWLSESWSVSLFKIAKLLVTLILFYSAITILYNAADFERRRWKIFSAGASFTTLLFILTSFLFGWVVGEFGNYDIYGTLGGIMVFLIYLNLNNSILLLGFELNTSINKARSVFDLELEKIPE